jgi:hypothetical protein
MLNLVKFHIYSKELPQFFLKQQVYFNYDFQHIRRYNKFRWWYYENSVPEKDYDLMNKIIKNKSMALLNIRNDNSTIRYISEEILRDNEIELILTDDN